MSSTTTSDQVKVLTQVGKSVSALRPLWSQWAEESRLYNKWFTDNNVIHMLDAITQMLAPDKVQKWLHLIPLPEAVRKVGIVMAGNIPLAGFHDFLSVLVSGHKAYAKLSSQDPVLLKKLANVFIDTDAQLADRIFFPDRLNGMDAVIATGSDNSARYFNFYFSAIPHLIKKNRTSIAIIEENQTAQEMQQLGKDIFTYFGLGCRNVSKLYVPEGYNFDLFYQSIKMYADIKLNNKYFNNYEYNRSIYLVNRTPHLDNDFLILTESPQLVSPISVVYYEHYKDRHDLVQKIAHYQDKLQIISSREGWFPNSIPFGMAQSPELWDYADGVDTLHFLTSI